MAASVPRKRQASGFTAIEIMLVVSIIGLLAVLAIPSFLKTRMRVHNGLFANDLRMLVDNVLEQYAITNGDYPADARRGVEPEGIRDFMVKRIDWTIETPIGGKWDWDRAAKRGGKKNGFYASLSVIRPQRTTTQMQAIDTQIDDGNLATGLFRSRRNGYVYILEE